MFAPIIVIIGSIACTIIQGAAHEDANIIFGAVLDEKMKDSVKITVIATGFRECDMRSPRHHESFDPVIVSRHHDRFHVPEPVAEPEPVFEPEPTFEPNPMPAAFQELASPAAHGAAQAEVISLDAMRSAPPSYSPEDLDVPAFMRKRNDVM